MTKLQELGAAVCDDVAGEHGTPCTIGMFVEIKGGGYWTGHVDVTSSREELEQDDGGEKWQDLVQKTLAHLYTHFKKSMATEGKDYSMNDILRFSVRISYSIPQEKFIVRRSVRRRCC